MHIAHEELLATPGELVQWMVDEGITFSHMTPPMTQLLTLGAKGSLLPALRTVFSLGDRLTVTTVESIRALAPGVSYVNSFGTTETQRAVGMYLIPPEKEIAHGQAVLPVAGGFRMRRC